MRCPPNAASGRPASSTRATWDDAATIRRRRERAACSMRFTTYERVEAARLVVIKRDGTRQEIAPERPRRACARR